VREVGVRAQSRLNAAIDVPNQRRERDAPRFGTGFGDDAARHHWLAVSVLATPEPVGPGIVQRRSGVSSLQSGGLVLGE
jgi:hypothetical protein